MALGAQRRDVLRLVVGQGLGLVAAGVGGGLAGAWGVSRLLESLLYGVRPGEPLLSVETALLLGAVSLLALLNAARWALALEPLTALRHE